MVDLYLEWREQNGKPISPRTLQGYRALAGARTKPGLGKLRLSQADPPVLDRFATALRKGGQPAQARGRGCRAAGCGTCTR